MFFHQKTKLVFHKFIRKYIVIIKNHCIKFTHVATRFLGLEFAKGLFDKILPVTLSFFFRNYVKSLEFWGLCAVDIDFNFDSFLYLGLS